MTSIKLFSILTWMLFSSLWATAQETNKDDPYADYSYLWEDSKEKAKEDKRKAKEEAKRQKELEKLRKKGLLPDTTSVTESKVALDSLPSDSTQYAEEVVADSTETKSEPVLEEAYIPSDTTITPSVTQDILDDLDRDVEEEEDEEEPKEKKEKKRLEGKPINDFRGGMGGPPSGGSFNGGFTFTQIDGQYFAGMTLSPDFAIGKVGVGLNIPILYGLDDKKIRTEIFEDGVGVARLITYIRYGVQKKDHVYVKVGQLDNTMVGYGGLVNNYTNTTSFEKRKVGLHYDLNWRYLIGIEGLYSDFNPGSANLFAIRPYLRPLGWMSVPIINTLEIGTPIVRDSDQTKIVTSDSTSTTYQFTKDGIGAFGVDMGLTLLRVPFIQIDLFAQYSKLNVSSPALVDSLETNYSVLGEPSTMSDGFSDGSGKSVGLNFRFNFIANLLSTDMRIERLSYTEHYLPQFFDATYEINKDARIYSLGAAEEMSGIYGSLTGHILQKVQLGGSLLLPDNISEETPATVRLNADVDRLADKVSMHASYIKGNLSTLEDAFTFDERSLAKVRFIYHMNKFLAVGMDYYWAFTPSADGGYKATQYISPYFGLSIAF